MKNINPPKGQNNMFKRLVLATFLSACFINPSLALTSKTVCKKAANDNIKIYNLYIRRMKIENADHLYSILINFMPLTGDQDRIESFTRDWSESLINSNTEREAYSSYYKLCLEDAKLGPL